MIPLGRKKEWDWRGVNRRLQKTAIFYSLKQKKETKQYLKHIG